MKATIFKIALLIIAIIVGFMYYGCESNPINPVEKDRSVMSFSISTHDKSDSYSITQLTYDIHDGEKFITWKGNDLIEIYLQSQVKYLEVNGCSSILINNDTYIIDKFTYDVHDGDKFIIYLNNEILNIFTNAKYILIE